MKNTRLTPEQMQELAPYERNFTQATKAAYCSYPGQAGIDKMLDIWQSLTGSRYPYQPGCANCLLNLVRDMGTIYFAQKDAMQKEEAIKDAFQKADAETAKAPVAEPAKSPKPKTRKSAKK
jgi:hypothetical protein